MACRIKSWATRLPKARYAGPKVQAKEGHEDSLLGSYGRSAFGYLESAA